MTSTASDTLPFHLQGAFAPVSHEQTHVELDVLGEIPPDLCGTYVRNGPNPRSGHSPAWFAGAGMLHGLRFEGGRARWYKNRWINGDYAPNTNIVRHAGKMLALVETRRPVAVTPELDTIGPYDFDGALDTPMTAHPRACPRTGDLLFFGYGPSRPHLTFYRADASGRVVHRAPIDAVPAHTYMHDFAITERYVVFYVLPVMVGDWRSPVPLRWDDSFPARLLVLPRDGTNADVRWFDIEPCTISHTANAYEDGDTIVLDATRGPKVMTAHALRRFTLDLRTGCASERELDPRFLDFPRVHPAVVGRKHRWLYTTELGDFTRDGGFTKTVVRQHDLERGTARVHATAPGAMPGECIVVPRPGYDTEDAAWAMFLVHRHDRRPTELVIVDTTRFDGPPVARVKLPCHVPFGLHAEWMPDATR